ncbi:plastocyanin [Enterococcus montenegrensis]|uniref:plastocyanin n=1 Tax=Enterococcus montenegrensis TaxID=3031993 RepID=UPI00249DA843|nr:plastocyanin [Enterococcus montenegrensis]WHA10133.1 plastocyanin [Enterococcus montenegrensis]
MAALTVNNAKYTDFIREKTKLIVSKGSMIVRNGRGFICLNFATPKNPLLDGLIRLEIAINSYEDSLS